MTRAESKEFQKYNNQDVIVEEQVFLKQCDYLFTHCTETDLVREKNVFEIYKRINHKGIAIDPHAKEVIKQITAKRDKAESEALKKFGKGKGDGTILRSPELKNWINKNLPKELHVVNVQAGTLLVLKTDVENYLKKEKNPVKKGQAKLVLNALEYKDLLTSQALNKILRLSPFDQENNLEGLCDVKNITYDSIGVPWCPYRSWCRSWDATTQFLFR